MMPGREEAIRLLRDSAAAVAPREGPPARIRALRDTPAGFDRAVVATMGGLGWLGLRVAEAAGGAGLGVAELAALAEEMGRGLVPEPFAAIAAVAAPLAPEPDVLAGETILLPAWAERPHTLDPSGATVLRGGAVSGRTVAVPMASGADGFVVTREAIQRHGGIGYTDEAEIGLFLRRATVLATAFGTAAAHRRRFAAAAPPLDLDA
jgi:alkylation response protein AidB-like acyl-CoA dehydrogenase